MSLSFDACRGDDASFRSLFYESPLPMWIVEKGSMRFVEVNEAAVQLYGYSREELLSMSVKDLRPEEPLSAVQADYLALTEGGVNSLDRRHRGKNGQYIDVQVNAHRVMYGGSLALAGIIVDISARMRAEEQLRLSDQRFSALIAGAMDAVVAIDEQDRVTLWGGAAEATFGWSAEEALGQMMVDLIVPEQYREQHLEGLSRYLGTGVPRIIGSRIEIVACDKSRSEFPVELTITEISAPGGVRFSAFVRDISDRTSRESELRESEQQLRFMAESMPQKVFTATPEGDVDYINPQWTEFTGLPFEELKGWGWTQLIHPGDLHQNVGQWKHSLATGEPFEFEHRFRRKDGEYRWHVTRAHPLRNDDGQVLMWVGSNTEIHEQKTKQRTLSFLNELAEATKALSVPGEIMQETARMLAEHLAVDRCAYAEVEDEVTFIITGDYSKEVPSIVGRWPVSAFGSACTAAMLANEPYVVIDADMDSRITPEDLVAYRATTIRAVICVPLHKNGLFTAAMAVHQKVPRIWSGDEVDLVHTVVGRCWESLERASSWRSLSDREEELRQANAVLQHERNRLATLLHEVPALIAVVRGPEHVFEIVNASYVKALGEREFVGLSARQVLPELKGQGYFELLDRVYRTGVPFVGREMPTALNREDGCRQTAFVDFVYQPIHEPDGAVSGILAFGVDVTDKVLSRQEVEKLNESLDLKVRERTAELQAANDDLEGFTYNISHDFRAPLRAIAATSSILKSDFGHLLPAEAIQQLDRQSSAAIRLAQITDDLLQLSKVSLQDIRRENVDLTDIALSVIKAEPWDDVEQLPRFEVQPGMMAMGDPLLLRLLLENLISNAVKFSPSGGTVSIGKTGRGEFFVRDSGIGFQQEYAQKMFDPFQRLVRDNEFPGTGVGLSNVKRIAERHGGSVWAESSGLGRGAVFYFTLSSGLE